MTLEHVTPGPESGFPTVVDPAVRAVYEQVKEYQHELDYTPSPNPDTLQEMIEDLNGQWPYMDSVICVSGLVRSAIVEQTNERELTGYGQNTLERQVSEDLLVPVLDEEGVPILKTYWVNDAGYRSIGFKIETEKWPETVGGRDDIGLRAVIKLAIKRIVEFNLDDGQTVTCELNTAADIDQVSLDFPFMSMEYAELRTSENFKESVDEIERRLKGKELYSERLMALRKTAIPLFDFLTESDKTALEMYLNDRVGVARENVPFMATLKKGTVFFDGDEQGQVVDFLERSRQLMVVITGISTFARCHAKVNKEGGLSTRADKDQFELRAQIYIIGRTEDNDTPGLEIRLRDIRDLANLREMLQAGPVNAEASEE